MTVTTRLLPGLKLWRGPRFPWRHLRLLIFLWCVFVGAPVWAAAGTTQQANITVETPAGMDRYAQTVMSYATAALRYLNETTGEPLLVPITFVVAEDDARFAEVAQGEGENTLAVAFGEQSRVVINYQAMSRSAGSKIQQVLVHELVHVYLDVKCLGRVPHWVHEGVAQHVAGEVPDAMGRGRLALAAYTGGLIPLSRLVGGFPADAEGRIKAYGQALSVVEYLVDTEYDRSLKAFLNAIKGESGREKLRELSGTIHLDALEYRWRNSIKSPVHLLMLMAGSGFFWSVAAVLLVAAYVVKRRKSAAMRRHWAQEEAEAGLDDSILDRVERFDESVIEGMDPDYTGDGGFQPEETPFDHYLAEREDAGEDEPWRR